MFGLVTDDQLFPAGNTELDPHNRWNRVRRVFGTLIDADATGYQAAIDLFQFHDARANEFLRPFLAFDIVERDFQGYLH
jgi:hypothetical protein